MANKEVIEADVVIVGAGLVGLSAAIALQAEGKRTVLVDGNKRATNKLTKGWDSRVYALTPATENWLQSLGVWPLENNARVNDVCAMALWNATSEIALDLKAEDANLNKLACIVENKNLMQALWQKVDALDIPLMMGSLCQDLEYNDEAVTLTLENGKKIVASLILAADGANSFVRQHLKVVTNVKPFDQMALVANYSTENGHNDIARQWFAPHNTLALLPLPNQHVSMVWSVSTEFAHELLKLTEVQLAERVGKEAHHVLGDLKPVSSTLSFALRQMTVSQLIAERVAFVGDAAHQVHPMAGQGANLGFRDVIALQAIMAGSHHLQDIGEETFLRQYERLRKADVASMKMLTTGLDHLFAQESNVINSMVVWGMNQLNKHASIKNILIKQATM